MMISFVINDVTNQITFRENFLSPAQKPEREDEKWWKFFLLHVRMWKEMICFVISWRLFFLLLAWKILGEMNFELVLNLLSPKSRKNKKTALSIQKKWGKMEGKLIGFSGSSFWFIKSSAKANPRVIYLTALEEFPAQHHKRHHLLSRYDTAMFLIHVQWRWEICLFSSIMLSSSFDGKTWHRGWVCEFIFMKSFNVFFCTEKKTKVEKWEKVCDDTQDAAFVRNKMNAARGNEHHNLSLKILFVVLIRQVNVTESERNDDDEMAASEFKNFNISAFLARIRVSVFALPPFYMLINLHSKSLIQSCYVSIYHFLRKNYEKSSGDCCRPSEQGH
jgi:hypothetical protein